MWSGVIWCSLGSDRAKVFMITEKVIRVGRISALRVAILGIRPLCQEKNNEMPGVNR